MLKGLISFWYTYSSWEIENMSYLDNPEGKEESRMCKLFGEGICANFMWKYFVSKWLVWICQTAHESICVQSTCECVNVINFMWKHLCQSTCECIPVLKFM